MACVASKQAPTDADRGPLSRAARGTDEEVAGDSESDTDCDMLVELRAHGAQSADDDTPFAAPLSGGHIEVFHFAPTWTEAMHVVRVEPLFDNPDVAAAMWLYMRAASGEVVGSHAAGLGLHPTDASLLFAAQRGNESFSLPSELGLKVVHGMDARFALDILYDARSNPADRGDRSGIRLCLTAKLRSKEAAIHWLGAENFSGRENFEVTGSCSPQHEAHIVATLPWMHGSGHHLASVLTRAGSDETTTLTRREFVFGAQTFEPVPGTQGEVVVRPGDLITTVCQYDAEGGLAFGPGLDSEQCYNYVLAWPAGALSNGSPGIVGGQNTCIDLE